MVPVHDGIVNAELEPLLTALVGQRPEQVFVDGGGFDGVVVGGLGVEEAETVVMLGGDDDVLDTRRLGVADPLGRIVFDRVELPGEFLVVGHGDVGVVHDPFADAGNSLPFQWPAGTAYSPQWMNMPKRASRHHCRRASRWAGVSGGGVNSAAAAG